MSFETIQAVKNEDDKVFVDEFPDTVFFDLAFLGRADPKFVQTFVEIKAENGEARYKIVDWNKGTNCLKAVRLHGSLAVLEGD